MPLKKAVPEKISVCTITFLSERKVRGTELFIYTSSINHTQVNYTEKVGSARVTRELLTSIHSTLLSDS